MLTAIGLASFSFGFISLAWAGVTGTITTVALTIYYSNSKVALLPTLSEFRHVMSIAGRIQWSLAAMGIWIKHGPS